MTREEFVKIAAYVAAGCGKALSAPSLEVYFDLLGDLPAAALQLAAKRVLLNHKYATFPSVAELREAATATARGEVTGLSAGEAWALGWNAIKATDPEVGGSFARATAGLPALVVRALEAMGVSALCYGTEPVTVVRAQFMKVYEQLAAREAAAERLPAATARAIVGGAGAEPRPLSLTAAPEGT